LIVIAAIPATLIIGRMGRIKSVEDLARGAWARKWAFELTALTVAVNGQRTIDSLERPLAEPREAFDRRCNAFCPTIERSKIPA